MEDSTLNAYKNIFGLMALFVLTALALLTPLKVLAQSSTGTTGITSPSTIDAAVARFTGANVGQTGGAQAPVDRRLRLAACPQPLALEWYGTRSDNVLVRCPAGPGWKLFVAVTPSQAAPAARSVAGPYARQVKAEPVIARGEAVAIKVRGNGFVLSRQGEALESGAIGEWIRIRPVDRSQRYSNAKPVRAQVSGPGIAVMRLP